MMRSLILVCATLSLTAACGDKGASSGGAASAGADIVLTNGRIKTPSGWTQALAVKSGRIIAVGDSDEIVNRYPSAKVVDLDNGVVLPGFHDLHVHPLYAGALQRSCVIEQGADLERFRQGVARCVENAEPGAWITGGQWDASAIGEVPTAAMIDDISPDNPVILNDTSGHSILVNTKAMQMARVTRDIGDPVGGIIERNADGEPTGVLREDGAIDLVRKLVPPMTDDEIRSALLWARDEMLANGITSYTEASLGFVAGIDREIETYAKLADEGLIKQRTELCINWTPGSELSERIIAERKKFARARVAPDCIKIFLDGVPTDSHTAAMLEPYGGKIEGRDDAASQKGLLLVDQKILNDAVTRFDKMRLTVKFHAAGDAAVRAGLDAIEAARKTNGDSGLHHNVGHCTFISEQDIPRAAPINATFELSPYLWSPSPINDDITQAIDDDRIERVWPFKEVVNSGALVVVGSDWAVVPSVNPWIAVESLVTREEMGGSERSFGKKEVINVEQALELFTINGAKQRDSADQLGSIEVGKLADIVVVDQDPYSVLSTRLHETKVRMTLIDGEIVYQTEKK